MGKLRHFDVSQVCLSAREFTVMIEEVPLSFKFSNRMVVSPAQYRVQYYALVGKGAVRIITGSIGNVVGIAGRIREVVRAIVFVHPGSFKKASVVVATQNGFSIFIQNHYFLHGLCKLEHVVAHFGYAGVYRRLVIFAQVGYRTVVLIFASVPSLQLAAPYPAKVHVVRAVVILKYRRVDAVAPLDGLSLGSEWTAW